MTSRRHAVLFASLVALAVVPLADAADHRDGPMATGDRWGDLGDLYAWPTDDDTIVVIVTFNGRLLPDAPDSDTFNADELPRILYTVHLDNDSAPLADPAHDWESQPSETLDSEIQIRIRFGQNDAGEWGVQVENLPGAMGTLSGPIGQPLGGRRVRAMAGLFDEPFFFDMDGWAATIANLDDATAATETDLAFRSLTSEDDNDTFAGTNTMAVVLEMDASEALGGNADDFLRVWATSGRLAR